MCACMRVGRGGGEEGRGVGESELVPTCCLFLICIFVLGIGFKVCLSVVRRRSGCVRVGTATVSAPRIKPFRTAVPFSATNYLHF